MTRRHTTGTRTARGFTLLETIMAASIGLVVVLAAMGVFLSMQRADGALARRAAQVTDLQKLHSVMRRSFTALSMSDAPAPQIRMGARESTVTASRSAEPAAGGTSGTGSVAAEAPNSAATGTSSAQPRDGAGGPAPGSAEDTEARARSGSRQATPRTPPPPRFVLASDARIADRQMILRLTGSGGGGGGGGATAGQTASSPQRFELVLAQAVVPPARPTPALGATVLDARSTTRESQESEERESGDDPAQAVTYRTKSVRGAFEVVPDIEAIAARRDDDDRPDPWMVVWRPLPPVTNTPTATGDLAEQTTALSPPPDEPVVIARGLAFVRWQVFHNMERRGEMLATWAQELPAYITMEVQTIDGLYANWMFEVDWVVQAEVESAEPSRTLPRLGDLPVAGGAREGRNSAARDNNGEDNPRRRRSGPSPDSMRVPAGGDR